MAKRIYRIISWTVLALSLWSIFLIFRKPSIPAVETSADAARSFDLKLSQAIEAHQLRTPRDIHITGAELNSKLQESLQSAPPPRGPARLKEARVNLEGDRLQGIFIIRVTGIDVYVMLEGNLGVTNGAVEFKPTGARMGSLRVPMALLEPTLRRRLNSPDALGRMNLPEYIKDVRIEDGELVLQAQ